LVPIYDDTRPKTLTLTGRTIKRSQTDGATDGQRHTIIHMVKDWRIKKAKQTHRK